MLITPEQIQKGYPHEAVKFMQGLEAFGYASKEKNEFGFGKLQEDAEEQLKVEYEQHMKALRDYVEQGNLL